jgi:hypothetical protein
VAFQKDRLYVNQIKCPKFAEALERQFYKNGEPDKRSGFDHITEAGGYAIVKNAYFN